MHGGVPKTDLKTPNVEAVKKWSGKSGEAYRKTLKNFGVPCVVAINIFAQDTAEELEAVREHCAKHGVNVALSDVFAKGGEGGIDLAKEVIALADSGESKFAPIYPLDMSLKGKIETIAKEIYGADGVNYTKEADKGPSRNLKSLATATCLSAWLKPSIPSPMTRHLLGRPSGFKITIRNCRIAAGAGFVVVLTGDVMTMPGLPKVPAAEKI